MATTSSTSSTSSASRYNLDEEDTSPILVFQLGPDMRSTRVHTTTQHDLCRSLDSDMKFDRCRVTKKDLPRFTPAVEILQHDLYFEHEKELYKQYPTYNSQLASINLPSNVFWGRSLLGSYPKLYIVSPDRSPASSDAGSAESRKITPSSTWNSHDGAASAEKTDE